MNRRCFIRNSTCAIGLSSTAVSAALQLSLANVALADSNSEMEDYKALVCVFLHGGNDSYNMLIPASEAEYRLYRETRGGMALTLEKSAEDTLRALPLSSSDNSRLFAVHPAIAELRKLYHQGRLAFLANVGTLVEPTTLNDYRRKSVRLPLSLFSHNDQRDQWHTAIPQSRGTSGWVGRATELLADTWDATTLSTAFSFSGNNLLQTGSSSGPFSVSANGGMSLNNPAAELLLNQQSTEDSLLRGVFAQNSARSLEKNRHYEQIISETPNIQNPYPNTKLGRSLKATAHTISARKRLGAKRQTFFVQSDGWDTHQDMLAGHHKNLQDLSLSMAAFEQSLAELGVSANVTTFTASEFGRTLVSNGRGTDHAWGGNAIIMGGAVSAGKIHGHYPEALITADGLDVGKNGRLLPTTANDLYFADLLRWYGLSDTQLFQALPNLENFLSPDNFQLNLNLMKT